MHSEGDFQTAETRHFELYLVAEMTISFEHIDPFRRCCWSKLALDVYDATAAGSELENKKAVSVLFRSRFNDYTFQANIVALQGSVKFPTSVTVTGLQTV